MKKLISALGIATLAISLTFTVPLYAQNLSQTTDPITTFIATSQKNSEMDEKYNKNLKWYKTRDEYITSLTGSSATKKRGIKSALSKDWKTDYELLKKNYDKITSSKGVNLEYVDSFIITCEILIEIDEQLEALKQGLPIPPVKFNFPITIMENGEPVEHLSELSLHASLNLTTQAKVLNEIRYNEAIKKVDEHFPKLNGEERLNKINFIFEEEAVADDFAVQPKPPMSDEVDIAYKIHFERKEYAYLTINRFFQENGDKNQTTIDNWEFNLKFLQDNYDKIVKMDNVNPILIDNYVEFYSCHLEGIRLKEKMEKEPKKQLFENNTAKTSAATFIGVEAAMYAMRH